MPHRTASPFQRSSSCAPENSASWNRRKRFRSSVRVRRPGQASADAVQTAHARMRAVYRLSPKGEWGQTVGGIFFLLLFWNACANECLLSDTLAGLASLCVYARACVCLRTFSSRGRCWVMCRGTWKEMGGGYTRFRFREGSVVGIAE